MHRCNVRCLECLIQFDFDIAYIRGKENVVADSLSTVPGSELLTAQEICNMCCTLGVAYVEDLPFALCDADVAPSAAEFSHTFLNGIISIKERDWFHS